MVGTTFAYDITCPGCTSEVLSDVYFLLATNYGKMSAAVSHTNIRAALSTSSVCENYGIRVTNDDKLLSKYVGHNLVKFYTTLFGASRIVALCNVLAIEQGLGRLSGVRPEPQQTDEVNADGNNTTQKESADKKLKDDAEKSDNISTQGNLENSFSKSTLSVIETSTKAGDADTTMSSASVDITSSMRNDDKPSFDKDAIVTDATPIVDKIVEPIAPTPVTQTVNGASPSEMPKMVEPEVKDVPEVVLVSDPEVNNNNEEGSNTNGNGNGNKPFLPGQGRESVWQKLSNRIKVNKYNYLGFKSSCSLT